ncbi:MAG: hypothetical protein R2881_09495 [Eubacteriales bacterium]
MLDCAKTSSQAGLKTVLVTNGMIEPNRWMTLLTVYRCCEYRPQGVYRKTATVLVWRWRPLSTVSLAQGRMHVELTTLIVPGFNDSDEQMREECRWIASLSEEIPLHLSRFFPRYRMITGNPTPVGDDDAAEKIGASIRTYI